MTYENMRIAIIGANGHMGKNLIRAANQEKNISLKAVIVRPGSSLIGKDAGILIGMKNIGINIVDNLYDVVNDFDVLVDFTHSNMCKKNVLFCKNYKKFMVIGTTGLDSVTQDVIKNASKYIGIVLSSNFSIGMNVVFKLLEKITHIIGKNTDIHIIETHHKNKKDAPSGTALTMKKKIEQAMNIEKYNISLKNSNVEKKQIKKISCHSIRAGSIIGEHHVKFIDFGEQLEISHTAFDRIIFAIGAIQAAQWLKNYPKGLYDMQNVLGLSDL